jgi:hypothetical protein
VTLCTGLGKYLYLSVASNYYFVCLRLNYCWTVSATSLHEDLHAFCESFGHKSLNITRSEKCAEKKTDVAEDERDTQFMRSTSLVLALRLLRQRNAEGSEIEGLLGNAICRHLTFPLRREFIIRLSKTCFIFKFIVIFFFFFHWHYSPLWALACRTRSFHFFLSVTNSLHHH